MATYDLSSDPALWLFVLAASTVCAGCLLPARWAPPIKNDKLAHFVAFGGLALLARVVANGPHELAYWLLGLMLAGLLIEVLQELVVPGRNFCWKDMLANLAGIFSSAILCVLFDYAQPVFFYQFA